jgi:hypothetical protein
MPPLGERKLSYAKRTGGGEWPLRSSQRVAKRRGNRLVVTYDDERVVYLAQPDRRLQIIEVSKTNLQFAVTTHGRYGW